MPLVATVLEAFNKDKSTRAENSALSSTKKHRRLHRKRA